MITLEHFCKTYGKSLAVDDVSFAVQKGRIAGLLGANGAGKSTILKAICAIHYPTSGCIFVEGVSVEDEPLEAKRKIGYVGENPQFYDSLTAWEFLSFVAQSRLVGFSAKRRAARIEETASACSADSVLGKKIRTLSKGYRQRLAFAAALVHNPAVLVLDEPVSGLDPLQIQEMRALIKKLESDKTILLSTHLMQEVEALCADIFVLSGGRLVAGGTKQEILAQAAAENLDDAFLNLSRYALQRGCP